MFQNLNWPAQKLMPSVRMVASKVNDYPSSAELSRREDDDSSKSYVAAEEPVVSTVED